MLTAKRKNEIEAIVNNVLQKYNITSCPADKLLLIMKSENILFFQDSIDDENFDGLITLNNDNQFCIYINTRINYEPRQNFTIAHELGHYFLNHELNSGSLICDRTCILEYRESNSIIEQEANYFAACLLMPKTLFSKSYYKIIEKLDRLKYGRIYVDSQPCNYGDWKKMICMFYIDFKVSILALRYRLEEFNLIDFNLTDKWEETVSEYVEISYKPKKQSRPSSL